MAREIDIVKEDGRWKVIRQHSEERFVRGQELIWTLRGVRAGRAKRAPKISAHFQFAHMDLVENVKDSSALSTDLTAVIPRAGGSLSLKVKDLACRRKNPRYYAVWIADSSVKGGGMFAVGEDGNPPPEMDIGP